jgi:plasmid stabilization system protein ParE
MALTLVWTKRAMEGYDAIVTYLEHHWSDKEVRNFIKESEEFFELLATYPELLQKTTRYKNVYRGPMNKLTIITYRYKVRTQKIEILTVRGARQKPLKK